MKKVILFDRSYLVIRDEQEKVLETKLNGTAKFWLNHLNGRDLIDPRAVARVTQAVANQDYPPEMFPQDLTKPAIEAKRPEKVDPEKARRPGENLHDWFYRVGKGDLCFCPKCLREKKAGKQIKK